MRLFITLRAIRRYGLNLNSCAGLAWLSQHREVSMGDMAAALLCSTANVTGIVDVLAAKGLAERSSGQDRRQVLVKITEAGTALMQDLNRVVASTQD